MEEESNENKQQSKNKTENQFKVPVPVLLVGKIGRFPKKIKTVPSSTPKGETIDGHRPTKENVNDQIIVADKGTINPKSEIVGSSESATEKSLNYTVPKWSGFPETNGTPYGFEVLKNGAIIDKIDLMSKPFYVFGRLADCDICMQHPTISRYHAVLQYRGVKSDSDPPGFYLYDLGSTHGTFLNGKNKLKPKMFVPIRVGYIIKLGCSQRSYILIGPDDDQEQESDLSITELKQLKIQKLADQEKKRLQEELDREERKRKEAEKGIDWGLGEEEDADDVEDLSENPYAQTNNEELYLDDPKKTLRGFFEREGFDLYYDCSEQGMGQFLCKVELPLDDEMGKPIIAEVLHRGKKKDAVIQCALEACRILDRFGALRQANHESKKRKSRNWEENDYYDSDEDTFLDRTGTIEKKREQRMKANGQDKAETYETLLEQENVIEKKMSEITNRLSIAQAALDKANNDDDDEDALDSYMKNLQDKKLDKHTISKLKFEIAKLKKDHEQIKRLINIAKPATIISQPAATNPKPVQKMPHIGKKRKTAVNVPKQLNKIDSVKDLSGPIEDMEDNEENEEKPDEQLQSFDGQMKTDSEKRNIDVELIKLIEELFGKEKCANANQEMTLVTDDIKDHLGKILSVLKHFESTANSKVVSTKKQKILKLVDDLKDLIEKNNLTSQKWILELVKAVENLIKEKCKGITNVKQIRYANQNKEPKCDNTVSKLDNSTITKSKNPKKEQTSLDESRSEYKGNFNIDKYCMWVPPDDQAGDGKTDLNKKYGY